MTTVTGQETGADQSYLGRSRFTYRNLADLATAAPTCPLRVIAHIDLDAYYAQCEMLRLGTGEDTPLVVQQWQNIIAVNYPARKFGITRMVNVKEAERLCPGLVVQHVATWKEGESQWAYHADAFKAMSKHKVSLEPYRIRSREILATIRENLPSPACKLEKAGIDEVFIDLSAYMHDLLVKKLYPDLLAGYRDHLDEPMGTLPLPPVLGSELDWASTGSNVIDLGVGLDKQGGDENQRRSGDSDGDGVDNCHDDREEEMERTVDWDDVAMLEGARVIRMIRQALYDKLQFRCSAGIASNKMLSKLGSSQHKPNKQTVVRPRAVVKFLASLSSVKKLRGLGGKMGARVVKVFDTESISELLTIPLVQIQAKMGDGESGYHIYWMIRGVDYSEVTARTEVKSIISAKSFQPPLKGMDQALQWLHVFVAEIKSRLLDERLSLALLAAATVGVPASGTTMAGQTAAAEAAHTTENAAAETEWAKDKSTSHTGGNVQSSVAVEAQEQQYEKQQGLRLPHTVRLHFGTNGGRHWRSRQTRIPRDGTPLNEEKLFRLGVQLLEQAQRLDGLWPCPHLALSVDGFEEPVKGNKSIESFFRPKNDSSATGRRKQLEHDGDSDTDACADDMDEEHVKGDIENDIPLTKRRRTEVPVSAAKGGNGDADQSARGEVEAGEGMDEQLEATSKTSHSNASAFDLLVSNDHPSHKTENDDSGTTGDGLHKCDRCSKSFATAVQLQEHQDWHVARALQAKERTASVPQPVPALAPASSSSKTAAAASATTAIRQRRSVPVKRSSAPISSFFLNKSNSPSTPRSDADGKEEMNGCKNGAIGCSGGGEGRGGKAVPYQPLVCPRCAAKFQDADGLQVHKDWHFAQDLQRG